MNEPVPKRYRVARAPVFYVNPQGEPSKDDVVLVWDAKRQTFEFHVQSENALKGWTFIVTQANLRLARDCGLEADSLERLV